VKLQHWVLGLRWWLNGAGVDRYGESCWIMSYVYLAEEHSSSRL